MAPVPGALSPASVAAVALGATAAALTAMSGVSSRAVVAVTFGGCLLACVLIGARALRLPGLPRTGGAWSRQILDGLLVGGTVYFALWHYLLAAGQGVLRLGDWQVPGALAVALVCAMVGVGSVAVLRSDRPRGRVAAAAAGLVLLSAAPLTLVLPLAWQWPLAESVSVAAIPVAGCLVLGIVGLGAEPRRSEPTAEDGLAPFGAVPTFFTVTVIAVETAEQNLRSGHLDPGSAFAGIPIVIMLAVRLWLALRDAHGYAARLADREAYFRRMANTDPLTSLANRRALRRALDRLGGEEAATLLAVDIDGFKDINDMYGHEVGDAVLVAAAGRLRATVGPGDLAVRLGGDEFAVLTLSSPEEACALAERLLAALDQPTGTGGLPRFSASVGVASCASASDIDGMMRNADLALRFAKQRGKKRVELFDAEYDRWLQRRLAIERELRGAIERDVLSLVYQPVVALPSGRPVGVEALVRWQHPTLGPLLPVEFVSVAEEVGLIGELGACVRRQACRQLARWLADGHTLWVAVNVSVRELRSPDFVRQVVDVLREHNIPPARLVLELTEHQVAQDVDQLASTLLALRRAGVRIALDDFGAGYSSLGQLQRLAVDILKIDRTLVGEPAEDPAAPTASLVDVVVRLGQRLGLEVIAEGVEDVRQRSVVEQARCRLVQGFLFGRPVPAERLEAMLSPTPRLAEAGGVSILAHLGDQ